MPFPSLFTHAEALVALDRLDEAVVEYSGLIEDRLGGADAFLRRAGLLQQLGRLPEAQADMLTAAQIEPALPWAHLRLAQMRHLRRELHPAADYVMQALARQPDCGEALNVAVAIFRDLEWLDRSAAAASAQAAEDGHWGESKRAALAAYTALHAETLARLRGGARDRSALLALAAALFRLGRLGRARALCEALMRDDPAAFPPFALCARIVARQEGPAAAAAFLRAVRFLHADAQDYRSALAGWEAERLSPAGPPPSP